MFYPSSSTASVGKRRTDDVNSASSAVCAPAPRLLSRRGSGLEVAAVDGAAVVSAASPKRGQQQKQQSTVDDDDELPHHRSLELTHVASWPCEFLGGFGAQCPYSARQCGFLRIRMLLRSGCANENSLRILFESAPRRRKVDSKSNDSGGAVLFAALLNTVLNCNEVVPDTTPPSPNNDHRAMMTDDYWIHHRNNPRVVCISTCVGVSLSFFQEAPSSCKQSCVARNYFSNFSCGLGEVLTTIRRYTWIAQRDDVRYVDRLPKSISLSARNSRGRHTSSPSLSPPQQSESLMSGGLYSLSRTTTSPPPRREGDEGRRSYTSPPPPLPHYDDWNVIPRVSSSWKIVADETVLRRDLHTLPSSFIRIVIHHRHSISSRNEKKSAIHHHHQQEQLMWLNSSPPPDDDECLVLRPAEGISSSSSAVCVFEVSLLPSSTHSSKPPTFHHDTAANFNVQFICIETTAVSFRVEAASPLLASFDALTVCEVAAEELSMGHEQQKLFFGRGGRGAGGGGGGGSVSMRRVVLKVSSQAAVVAFSVCSSLRISCICDRSIMALRSIQLHCSSSLMSGGRSANGINLIAFAAPY